MIDFLSNFDRDYLSIGKSYSVLEYTIRKSDSFSTKTYADSW